MKRTSAFLLILIAPLVLLAIFSLNYMRGSDVVPAKMPNNVLFSSATSRELLTPINPRASHHLRMPTAQRSNHQIVDGLLQQFESGDGEALDAKLVAAHFADILRRLKDGDPIAARLLHQSLATCKGSYSPKELNDLRISASSRNDEIALRSIAAISAACSPFSGEQIAADWEIVKAGIDLGDDSLKVQYYTLDPGVPSFDSRYSRRLAEYNDEALAHLNQAASDGFPDAYWALGDAYMEGKIVPRDFLRAYGYQLAWLESQRATFLPSEWEAFHSALVRDFGTRLTAEQQLDAQFLANRLLSGDNS
ncbi:MAG TPA: hypothetical protein VFN25_16110 [Dokdonella sp.]|uniref:hypothetical protein n=1 Tax=Dokdonella sp. TaxID=2291710 RepID=UPI002D7FDF58|nr:hypothetical protein [Dokdonella sp.]HET9034416.1 hypothetical protein [Dokdonella sp.]